MTPKALRELKREYTHGSAHCGIFEHWVPALPKVFFRYYFVNSATGEKSGIMLASSSPEPRVSSQRAGQKPVLTLIRTLCSHLITEGFLMQVTALFVMVDEVNHTHILIKI